MSRVRIYNSAGAAFLRTGYGTVIELDGKEVPSVRSICLNVGMDDAITTKIEVLASQALDVEIDAIAQITVVVMDQSLAIEETVLPGGGRRLRAVPAVVPR